MKKILSLLSIATIAFASFTLIGCSNDDNNTEAISKPVAEIVEINAITRESAIVNIKTTGENLTSFGIRYATSLEGVSNGTILESDGDIVTITGLKENKTYYVQAFASNLETNVFSEIVSFETDGPKEIMKFLNVKDLQNYIATYTEPENVVKTLVIGGEPDGADCDDIANLGGEGNRFPSLNSLVFSEAKTIPSRAFYDQNNKAAGWLTSFTAPEVTTVKEFAFMNCKLLTSISFPKLLKAETFSFYEIGITEITSAHFPMITSVADYTFNGYKLTKLELPTVTNAGNILYAASVLKSVELGMTIIPNGFMQYCVGIEELTEESFPKAIKIGSSAFSGCTRLTKAHFPNVTEISSSAFASCNNLVELYFNKDLETIASDAFARFPTANCDLYITSKTAESAVDGTWQGVTWKSINIIQDL